MKNIWRIILIIVILTIAWGWYVYRTSQQKPTDVMIANVQTGIDTQITTSSTSDVLNASGTIDIAPTKDDATGANVSDQFSLVQGSVIWWKAGKPTGAHTGTVNFVDGFIRVENNQIVAGEFTADMPTLQMLDFDNPNLLSEIKDKFFEVTKYPIAKFVFTRTFVSGTQTMVEGQLTIKDITNTVTFPANIRYSPTEVIATAQFAIDKNQWGLSMWDNIMNKYLEFTLNIMFQPAF